MLNRLLELLRSGGTYRVVDLARKLETAPALVEEMLRSLERMGYLKSTAGTCGGKCAQCPMSGLCAVGKGEQIWALTGKAPN
jgi:DNA-binding IscR family transcriptional regulator